MSAGDIIISMVTWFYKGLVGLLPVEIPNLSLSALTGYLDGLKTNLVDSLTGISQVFPVDLLLIIISVVIAGEILLFGFKAGVFVINIVRGSGA